MALPAWKLLARGIAAAALLLAWVAAGPVAPARGAPSAPVFHADASPGFGLPGAPITVTVTSDDATADLTDVRCTAGFGTVRVPCTKPPRAGGWTAALTVPPDPEPLTWQISYGGGGSDTGTVDFTVLLVDVTAAPSIVTPGGSVRVGFTARTPNLVIDDCGVQDREWGGAACPRGTSDVDLPVPADAAAGRDHVLSASFSYTYRSAEASGKTPKPIPVTVGVATPSKPPSLPKPVFTVTAETAAAEPGVPFVVTFASGTPGVRVSECGLTYQVRAACSESGVAAVAIPADARSGSTIRLRWDLAYATTRPGDRAGTRTGELSTRVVVSQPKFLVDVQPGRGKPGQEVTVTITPADPGVGLAGCLVFFPSGDEVLCQKSARRWFARTRVPADALPAATVLRWGVSYVDEAARRGADNGVLPFQVLAGPKPSTSGSSSGPAGGSTGGSTGGLTGGSTTGPAVGPARGATTGRAVFVAAADPEQAKPGQKVTVTVSALPSGTDVTGCSFAFAGYDATTCRHATATLVVPPAAQPGDLSLHWAATAGSSTGGGTIAYRVVAPGAPGKPQFSVTLQPSSVRPGGHVTVSPRPYDAGVSVTGCSASFGTSGKTAPCRKTAQGFWVADVTVPSSAAQGLGTITWQAAYTGAGTGSATGVTSLGVLAVSAPEGFWSNLRSLSWRLLVGGLVLAALVTGARLRNLRRRKPSRADGEPAAAVTVVPVVPEPRLLCSRTNAEPRHLIRLTARAGSLDIRLHEEIR